MTEGSTGVMIPRVHWNGTGKDELVKQLSDAMEAVNSAIIALARATPHGRDYYAAAGTGGEEAIVIARNQHVIRLAKLESVYQELQEMGEGVATQKKCG